MKVKINYFFQQCITVEETQWVTNDGLIFPNCSLMHKFVIFFISRIYMLGIFFQKTEPDAEEEVTCLRCQEKFPNLVSLKNHLMRKHSAIVSVWYKMLRMFLHRSYNNTYKGVTDVWCVLIGYIDEMIWYRNKRI